MWPTRCKTLFSIGSLQRESLRFRLKCLHQLLELRFDLHFWWEKSLIKHKGCKEIITYEVVITLKSLMTYFASCSTQTMATGKKVLELWLVIDTFHVTREIWINNTQKELFKVSSIPWDLNFDCWHTCQSCDQDILFSIWGGHFLSFPSLVLKFKPYPVITWTKILVAICN